MSLYKRKNSQYWWAGFQVNGKRYQFSTKTGNKARARQIETALKEKIRLKATYGITFGEPSSPPFDVAAKAWLLETTPDVAEASATRYERHVKALINFFGEKPCHEITPDDIHFYKAARLKGRANTTVANELTVLKSILKRLVRRDEIDRSPAESVRPPQLGKIEDRVLNEMEMDRYLKAADDHLRDFAKVMTHTGARPSELLKVRPSDIKDGKLVIRAGKTKGARRVVPLTDEAEQILKERMPDLFQKYKYLQLYRAHQKAIDKAGIAPAKLYSFRHKFATDLISKGVPDSVAAKLLGHANLGTIHKYVHPSSDDLERAIEALESD